MLFDLGFQWQMANWLGTYVFFGLHLFSCVSHVLGISDFLVCIVSILLQFFFVYAGAFSFCVCAPLCCAWARFCLCLCFGINL